MLASVSILLSEDESFLLSFSCHSRSVSDKMSLVNWMFPPKDVLSGEDIFCFRTADVELLGRVEVLSLLVHSLNERTEPTRSTINRFAAVGRG